MVVSELMTFQKKKSAPVKGFQGLPLLDQHHTHILLILVAEIYSTSKDISYAGPYDLVLSVNQLFLVFAEINNEDNYNKFKLRFKIQEYTEE